MIPTTIHELISFLNQIAVEQGGQTAVEFQDYDEDERNVEIILENKINCTEPSKSSKKLIIRYI